MEVVYSFFAKMHNFIVGAVKFVGAKCQDLYHSAPPLYTIAGEEGDFAEASLGGKESDCGD